MVKRIVFTLIIIAVLVGALGFFKMQQIQAAMKAANFQPPPTAVTTVVAKTEDWSTSLKAIGSVVAVQGVTVSADLPGIVERISFDSGRLVQAGEVLVQLDTRQERAQLAAAEAARDLARINYQRAKSLSEAGAIPRQNYDQAAADKDQTEARVGEIRATIERKTIRAPFTGALGIRQVNLGQYLSAGSAIVPLQSLNPIYVNFSVPQESAALVKVGQRVHATSSESGGPALQGQVTAIDSVIDESTRNVRIQATFSNVGSKLHPGMFVDAELQTGGGQQVIALPASAISYAPYGDSVFVVAEMKDSQGKTYRGVKQQFVKVSRTRGDQVAIVSGLAPGDEVVTSGTFKLRNGAAVVVNNKVQPSNNSAPKPEDS